MYKLTPVECFKYQVVMNESLSQLAFLGRITTNAVAQKDELSQMMGDEISRLIVEQRELERRYEHLIATRGTLKGLANKGKFREIQIEIQDVARSLRESTKTLCRSLKDNPNITGNLLKIQVERTRLQELIASVVNDLNEYSFQGLVAQVEEERHDQGLLAEVKAREKEASSAVKQLQSDLQKEIRDHERETKEASIVIQKLKEELAEERTRSSIRLRYQEKEARARENTHQRLFLQQERHLRAAIDDLSNRKQDETTVYTETRQFLEKRTEYVRSENISWSERYDKEIEVLDEKLSQLKLERQGVLEKLEHFAQRRAEDAEEARKEEIREQEAEEAEKAKRRLADRKRQAARLIWSAWLTFKVILDSRPKGKKGSKGKKKK